MTRSKKPQLKIFRLIQYLHAVSTGGRETPIGLAQLVIFVLNNLTKRYEKRKFRLFCNQSGVG